MWRLPSVPSTAWGRVSTWASNAENCVPGSIPIPDA